MLSYSSSRCFLYQVSPQYNRKIPDGYNLLAETKLEKYFLHNIF